VKMLCGLGIPFLYTLVHMDRERTNSGDLILVHDRTIDNNSFCLTCVIGYKSGRYRIVNTIDGGDDGDGGSERPWGPDRVVDGFVYDCVLDTSADRY
jgi:hypothetical protein